MTSNSALQLLMKLRNSVIKLIERSDGVDKKARLILKRAIELLDEHFGSVKQQFSYRKETEQLSRDDTSSLEQHISAAVLLLNLQTVTVQTVCLTPSLMRKGWRFWEKPLLTEYERKAVNTAFLKFTRTGITQAKALKQKSDKSSKEDMYASLLHLSSLLDMLRANAQQLSDDLKQILQSAEAEGD